MNFQLLWPEFLVTALGFLVLTIDFVLPQARRNLLAWLVAAGLTAILVFTLVFLWGKTDSLYDGVIRVDGYALFFKVMFIVLGTFVVLSSAEYVEKYLTHPGEFYGILLFSIVAMMLMAASGELLTAYISLELLSFSLYVLVSLSHSSPRSHEAGVKYILLGAFSSALLLYGISLLYGVLGVTRFDEISAVLMSVSGTDPILVLGLVFLITGLGFKVAAVPFHMWVPDVYEGAPTPITAYLAVGSKAAAFALVLRLFAEGLIPAMDQWRMVLAGLAVATMSVGNLVALAQQNIKRLLAYSSIGQVGYMLMGIAALSPMASTGLMFHIVGYAFSSMIVFVGVIAFINVTGKERVDDFMGLADRSPFLAACLTVGFFSLAGLPFLAGFATKFYLFTAVAKTGMLWMAGLAIFFSLISLYYYLLIIRRMYVDSAAEEDSISVKPLLKGVLGLLALGIFAIGIYPSPLVDAIEFATLTILPSSGGIIGSP